MKDGTQFEPTGPRDEESFHALLCADCERDATWRDTEEVGSGCLVLAQAFQCEAKDSPKEWIWKDGKPYCKAYVRPGECVLCIDNLTLPLFPEEL